MSTDDFIRLRDGVKRDEGFKIRNGRHVPYKDTVGKLTIGYGHNLDDNGLKQKFADLILDDDIKEVIGELVVHLPWFEALIPPRQAVLVNMGVNMGVPRLLKFTKMLAAAKAGNHDVTAIEMLSSLWADQVGERALRLAEQMRLGVWV
jgi:lysozyme